MDVFSDGLIVNTDKVTGAVSSVKLDVNSEQFQGVKKAAEAIDDDD